MPERIAQRLALRLGEEALRRWPVFKLLAGLALIVLGAVAAAMPTSAAMPAVRLLGAILFVAGLVQLGLSLTVQPPHGPGHNRSAGLANLAVGSGFLANPHASVLALSMVLAIAYVVVGLYKIITAVSERSAHWPWTLALGVLLVVFGTLIGLRWPESSFKVIGRFVGMQLIAEGVTWLTLVRQSRQAGTPPQLSP